LKRAWENEEPYFDFVTWTKDEKWHVHFFECDWARYAENVLHVWFRIALRDCGAHVFSIIVQRMLENPRNNRDYIWEEYMQDMIRRRTLADWLDVHPDDVRRHHSEEGIREKQRGIEEFLLPYKTLVSAMTNMFYLALHSRMDVICTDHYEVEKRLFPELYVVQ
jgi:hypothetical protein